MKLYEIEQDVLCMRCQNIGAVKYFGDYNDGKINHAIGFGGTIPYKCLRCDATGLIGDVGGLEGYMGMFKRRDEIENL